MTLLQLQLNTISLIGSARECLSFGHMSDYHALYALIKQNIKDIFNADKHSYISTYIKEDISSLLADYYGY